MFKLHMAELWSIIGAGLDAPIEANQFIRNDDGSVWEGECVERDIRGIV